MSRRRPFSRCRKEDGYFIIVICFPYITHNPLKSMTLTGFSYFTNTKTDRAQTGSV